MGLAVALVDLHHGVAGLLGPGLHNGDHIQTARLAQGLPEVTRAGVGVLELAEVVAETGLEAGLAQEGREHADNRRALGVRDAVEDLINLVGVLSLDLDGVRGLEAVKSQAALLLARDELLPNLPLGKEVVNGQPADPGGETLVQPQVGPPLHGHIVAEPLVGLLRVRVCAGGARVSGGTSVCGLVCVFVYG